MTFRLWRCLLKLLDCLNSSAWVTQPELPKGAMDEVKKPKGPPAKSRAQRALKLIYLIHLLNDICQRRNLEKVYDKVSSESK